MISVRLIVKQTHFSLEECRILLRLVCIFRQAIMRSCGKATAHQILLSALFLISDVCPNVPYTLTMEGNSIFIISLNTQNRIVLTLETAA